MSQKYNVLMMAHDVENIAILNVKGVDYRCVLWNITRNDAVNRLNNFKLDDKGLLWTYMLVQIKHLLTYLKREHLEELILDILILVLMVNGIEMERI